MTEENKEEVEKKEVSGADSSTTTGVESSGESTPPKAEKAVKAIKTVKKNEPVKIKKEVANIDSNEDDNDLEEKSMKSIALVISIVAFILAAFNFLSLSNIDKETRRSVENALAPMQVSMQTIEEKVEGLEKSRNGERHSKGILELRKALISFQEAQGLIDDKNLVHRLKTLEMEVAHIIAAPGRNTGEVILPVPGESSATFGEEGVSSVNTVPEKSEEKKDESIGMKRLIDLF